MKIQFLDMSEEDLLNSKCSLQGALHKFFWQLFLSVSNYYLLTQTKVRAVVSFAQCTQEHVCKLEKHLNPRMQERISQH